METNTKIEVGGATHEKSFLIATQSGQAVLRSAKDLPNRPRCLCCAGKPEMYIGRRGGHFYISRMPGSGNEHADGCRSHISESYADSSELTAGQLLEKLWNESLLTIDKSKRYWYAIRQAVINAAININSDERPLSQHLLVPDIFTQQGADKLKQAYDEFYARQAGEQDKQIRYWTFGILKKITERQYSYQATLKHMPNTNFWVHKDLFDIFPPMPRPEEETVLCLFSCRRSRSGVDVDEAATLLIDANLQPVEWTVWEPPSAPTDEMIEAARVKLGLPESAGRDAVFGTLVSQLLGSSQ